MPSRLGDAGGENPEWDLLLRCSRTDASSVCEEEIGKLAGRDPDWDRLTSLVFAHGVSGLVSKALSELPGAGVPQRVRESLREQHVSVARANLGMTASLQELLEAFEGQGIPVIPLKGPALADRAYGDVSLRTFSDLDLLIRREDLEEGRNLLRTQGLAPLPELSALPDRLLFRWSNEEPLLTPDGTLVELHWDLSSPAWRTRLEAEGFWERVTPHTWRGRSILGLSAEDQLHFLCTHGCRHAWSRLVWVCDVAETLRSETVDWSALAHRARESGTMRMLRLGLGLANQLLEGPLPEEVRSDIVRDAAVGDLVTHVTGVLKGDGVPAREEFLFQARTRDRIADRIDFFFGALITPTLMDLRGVTSGPGALGRRFVRPLRLARKYWRLQRHPEGWDRDRP